MKIKISLLLLCTVLVFQVPARCEDATPQVSSPSPRSLDISKGKDSSSRGLFVSLVQDPPVLSSREEILKLIAFAKRSGTKVLFVQVYRANQAWFPSKVGDVSLYEAAVKSLGEDPFSLLLREAHGAGLKVHAWLNMLSLATNENAPLLKKYGPDILTRDLKEKKALADYKIDDQYFLEPGDARVRQELLTMVGEIVRAHPELDGILFDYIRYPDSQPHSGYTPVNIERFKKATGLKKVREGSRAWSDWKRNQVTELLSLLVKSVRDLPSQIRVVSATGCMSYDRAFYEAFQDWPSWVNKGLVDFVAVMDYSADPAEYSAWAEVAKGKVKDPQKLYLGVPAYKLVKAPETFRTEWKACESSGVALCAVFHYGSLLENAVLEGPLLDQE